MKQYSSGMGIVMLFGVTIVIPTADLQGPVTFWRKHYWSGCRPTTLCRIFVPLLVKLMVFRSAKSVNRFIVNSNNIDPLITSDQQYIAI